MKLVLIGAADDGVQTVVDVLTPAEGLDLGQTFPPEVLEAAKSAPDDVDRGWTTSDGGETFSAPVAPSPIAPTVVSVSSAQAKIQCLRTDGSATGKTLLDDITAAVQAAGGEVAIWFTDARTWERSSPYVASLSDGLKLTSAQVDRLFAAAAKISA